MKETFLAFLGKTLNLPADRLAEILFKKSDDGATFTDDLNDGVLEALVKLDSERVGKLKPDTKPFFDNGYKKAQVEVSEKWEGLIRQKFGIDSDATGEDLVIAALEKAGKSSKIEDEKVKMHPLYLKMEKDAAEALKTAKAEGEKMLEDFKTGVQKQSRLSSVQAEVRKLFLSRRPVLSTDPAKQENQISMFLNRFAEYDYEPLESGGWLPMKDGKRIENAHAHPIDLQTLVNEMSEQLFDFQVQDPKGNGGNGNPAGGNGNQGPKPATPYKTKQDFETAYFAETDTTKRSEIAKTYEAAQRE